MTLGAAPPWRLQPDGEQPEQGAEAQELRADVGRRAHGASEGEAAEGDVASAGAAVKSVPLAGAAAVAEAEEAEASAAEPLQVAEPAEREAEEMVGWPYRGEGDAEAGKADAKAEEAVEAAPVAEESKDAAEGGAEHDHASKDAADRGAEQAGDAAEAAGEAALVPGDATAGGVEEAQVAATVEEVAGALITSAEVEEVAEAQAVATVAETLVTGVCAEHAGTRAWSGSPPSGLGGQLAAGDPQQLPTQPPLQQPTSRGLPHPSSSRDPRLAAAMRAPGPDGRCSQAGCSGGTLMAASPSPSPGPQQTPRRPVWRRVLDALSSQAARQQAANNGEPGRPMAAAAEPAGGADAPGSVAAGSQLPVVPQAAAEQLQPRVENLFRLYRHMGAERAAGGSPAPNAAPPASGERSWLAGIKEEPASISHGAGGVAGEEEGEEEQRACSNCGTCSTSRWQRHLTTRALLCNLCGNWCRKHGGQLPPLDEEEQPVCTHCGRQCTEPKTYRHPESGQRLCVFCRMKLARHGQLPALEQLAAAEEAEEGSGRQQQLQPQQQLQMAAAAAGAGVEPRVCTHCGRDDGSKWSRHPTTRARLCNRCGNWTRKHGGRLPALDDEQQPVCTHCGSQCFVAKAFWDPATGQRLCGRCRRAIWKWGQLPAVGIKEELEQQGVEEEEGEGGQLQERQQAAAATAHLGEAQWVCTHCGTDSTCQWRRHPVTAVRLCSACCSWARRHHGQLPALGNEEEEEEVEVAEEATAGGEEQQPVCNHCGSQCTAGRAFWDPETGQPLCGSCQTDISKHEQLPAVGIKEEEEEEEEKEEGEQEGEVEEALAGAAEGWKTCSHCSERSTSCFRSQLVTGQLLCRSCRKFTRAHGGSLPALVPMSERGKRWRRLPKGLQGQRAVGQQARGAGKQKGRPEQGSLTVRKQRGRQGSSQAAAALHRKREPEQQATPQPASKLRRMYSPMPVQQQQHQQRGSGDQASAALATQAVPAGTPGAAAFAPAPAAAAAAAAAGAQQGGDLFSLLLDAAGTPASAAAGLTPDLAASFQSLMDSMPPEQQAIREGRLRMLLQAGLHSSAAVMMTTALKLVGAA